MWECGQDLPDGDNLRGVKVLRREVVDRPAMNQDSGSEAKHLSLFLLSPRVQRLLTNPGMPCPGAMPTQASDFRCVRESRREREGERGREEDRASERESESAREREETERER